MAKYIKLDDVLDCANDFFLCGQEDIDNFKSCIEDECEIIDVKDKKTAN